MAEPIENLRGRVDALTAEIRSLADAEDITTEQDARLDAALDELDEARTAIEQAEIREARLAKLATATPAADVVVNERTIVAPNVNVRTNPFDLDELRSADPEKRALEVSARARDIVNSQAGGYVPSHEGSEELIAKLDGRSKVSRDIAELVVQTGSEEYRDLFEAALRDPANLSIQTEIQARQREIHSRAAVQMPNAAGALTIPYVLDPTVILNNTGVIDPMRQVSRNVQITGTDKWVPVTTTGVTAGWIGESVAFTDATPTWTSGGISVFKAGAFAFGSYEALADADVAGELTALFADAKARLEGTAFATGTGSAQPQGIVTYASNATSLVAGSSGASGAADLTATDVYALRNGLSPRWRDGAVFMSALQIAHKIRQLGTTDPNFTLNLTQADMPTILGKPYYENSSMDTTIVSGSTDDILIHGDFSNFAIVDRVGAVIQYQPIVTSGSKFPTGESAWHVYWRVGSGGLVQDAFRMLLL